MKNSDDPLAQIHSIDAQRAAYVVIRWALYSEPKEWDSFLKIEQEAAKLYPYPNSPSSEKSEIDELLVEEQDNRL